MDQCLITIPKVTITISCGDNLTPACVLYFIKMLRWEMSIQL